MCVSESVHVTNSCTQLYLNSIWSIFVKFIAYATHAPCQVIITYGADDFHESV